MDLKNQTKKGKLMIKKIAVIDTETNWENDVMSIGVMIADSENYRRTDSKYYILNHEAAVGGMYSYVLNIKGHETINTLKDKVLEDLDMWLKDNKVEHLYAYNANFDKTHLPELSHYTWHDIMKLAAYKQYNKSIPDDLPCCKSGRLKSGYGVEQILRMLGLTNYTETHNALMDARDELKIMELLNLDADLYPTI